MKELPSSGQLSLGDDSVLPIPGLQPRYTRGGSVVISSAVIAVGAALGALLRWYLANRLNGMFPRLPPGTLSANMLGGYLVGVAMAVFLTFPSLSPQWRLLTVTGFLGGLTTFSTFSAEIVTALLEGRNIWAALTATVHVLGSVAMTLLGVGTVRLFKTLF